MGWSCSTHRRVRNEYEVVEKLEGKSYGERARYSPIREDSIVTCMRCDNRRGLDLLDSFNTRLVVTFHKSLSHTQTSGLTLLQSPLAVAW
jgi:hypothetical protein